VLDSATVGIQGNVFSPGMVAVGAGGTVTWTNNDGVAHTVNGGPVQSSVLDPGASFSYTFGSSGHFTYMCAIHPDMKGMVMVG
jgi:plastocyanin